MRRGDKISNQPNVCQHENNSAKNSPLESPKAHAHICIIGKKSTKFQKNQMKDVEQIAGTRFHTDRMYVSMGNTSVKNNPIFISQEESLQNFKHIR